MKQTIINKNEDCVTNAKRRNVDMDDSRMEYSRYARFFDPESYHWYRTDNSAHRLLFLKYKELYANAKLRAQGYLLLNEVYEMLGIPRSEDYEGIGWVFNEKNPIGDNYVDFGVYDNYNLDFINGVEVKKVLLDFNVDGYISDYI